MKPYLIAGNWKMNNTIGEGKTLIEALKTGSENPKAEVAIIVPATHIQMAVETAKGSNIQIGAQNCHFEEKGAFTGEISPVTLKDMGVSYVTLGHSERREYFGETDELIAKKVKAVLNQGMTPILCVGETLEQRKAGKAKEVNKTQLLGGLKGITEINKVVVAYEPVWAIGTGVTATTAEAQEICEYIQNVLVETFGEAGKTVIIQYGGSMKPDNAEELLGQNNIFGGLIGGASLVAEDFKQIINSCK